MMYFRDYQIHVFDCDGVVLNSNKIKTEAFYQAALPYGETAARRLVEYHTSNGGMSRYKKFAHFLDEIVPVAAPGRTGPSFESLLKRYADGAREGLMTCEVAPGLQQLRDQAPNAKWLIVSAGDQDELREIFAVRGLADLFDGGIYGSPRTKIEILEHALGDGPFKRSGLLIGDSKYDYEAAMFAGLDFVFLSDWTEVNGWQEWADENSISVRKALKELLFDPV
ncbi:HAD family hydrolase [Natronospirillum operosum]|uniref:phosphoglycolate phosphatase n=2 Tax=Natronospirillum operosum TaxID=2759953 RepID=A0A4Z0WDG5_9GAMM|nr:HAD family hydrolase [Natronospirillum operosum]